MVLLEIEFMEILVDLLMFIVPAGIVFGVTYFLVNKFLLEQRKVRLLDIKKEQTKLITPVKLQAYERLTLFLDRISPDNLVLRLSKSGQSAKQLRQVLIQTITEEFNHNISQQIYVSDQAWQMIKEVKEQVIGIIENCYNDCSENESGPGLGKIILTKLMANQQIPTQKAIELLKKEIEVSI